MQYGSAVRISGDFPDFAGRRGTLGCDFSEPNAYTGESCRMWFVWLTDSGPFRGRPVRVPEHYLESQS